jgi:hypothetical protein
MAQGRKTGGRQKGVKNKRTIARESAVAEAREHVAALVGGEAFKGDAHALLTFVYCNPEMEWDLRVEAAGKALPYEKPKLQSIEHSGDKAHPIKHIFEWAKPSKPSES